MGSLDAIEALEHTHDTLLCPWCHQHPAMIFDEPVRRGAELLTLVLPCLPCALDVFYAVHGDTSASRPRDTGAQAKECR
jgi:hypothetical protein